MFKDRWDAGARLARALTDAPEGALVLGIPRGGVIVARALADALHADLDVIVAHKLGAPSNPELAIGAAGPDGTVVLERGVIDRLGEVSEDYVARQARREMIEIERRMRSYRGARERLEVAGRACIVVDDGIATGSTAHAALAWLRRSGATPLLLAVPVAPVSTGARLGALADRIVCLLTPEDFRAVGQWYERFDEVTDEQVIDALARDATRRG